MACIDEQQPNFKHYCRVCKKGFMCGRALGGHMRAHGIGDESGNLDGDDPISDWEEKFGGGSTSDHHHRTSNKRMYKLRTNPNRLKSCRTCENCGKEFLSWKSFLEHGKCSSDDASEYLVSLPDRSEEGEEDVDGTGGGGGSARGGASRWSKRKRSFRSKVGCYNSTTTSYPPSEEDDILLARCLVQLANTAADPPSAAEPEDSCASISREAEERRNPNSYYIGPPKSSNRVPITFVVNHKAKGVSNSPKGMFECKACKKVFNSHQALGGHRASHKKVKGCYASKQDQVQQDHDHNNSSALAIEDDVITNNNEEFLIPPSSSKPNHFQFEQQGPSLVGAARRKAKVHECSICHRVFTSGQALGGHKRCHWITSKSPKTTSSLPKFQFQDNINRHKPTNDISDKQLDLNVPAWAHVSGLTRNPPDPLSIAVSIDMQLQPWIVPSAGNVNDGLQLKNGPDDNNNIYNGNMIVMSDNVKNETVDSKNTTKQYVDDEVDSKLIKLAKLSDLNGLKEMDNSGSSSQWLQVGIGSTTEAAADV